MRWLDDIRFNGHECEQALGYGKGQGSLACCRPWGPKESDTTERLNNNWHLPYTSTRIKSCDAAAADFQHVLKGAQGGEQK